MSALEEWEQHRARNTRARNLVQVFDAADAAIDELKAELKNLRKHTSVMPVIPVKWTQDGWTNTAPVALQCETDGYIDWPVKLTIVSDEEVGK